MEQRTKRPDNIRPKMRRLDRAKQFAPFAALGSMTGVLMHEVENFDAGDPDHVIDPEFLDIEETARDASGVDDIRECE